MRKRLIQAHSGTKKKKITSTSDRNNGLTFFKVSVSRLLPVLSFSVIRLSPVRLIKVQTLPSTPFLRTYNYK